VFILPHNSSISTYEKITVWLGPHETVNKHTCTEILLLWYEADQHFQLTQSHGHEWKMDAEFDSCDEIKQHYASDLLYPGAGLKILS